MLNVADIEMRWILEYSEYWNTANSEMQRILERGQLLSVADMDPEIQRILEGSQFRNRANSEHNEIQIAAHHQIQRMLEYTNPEIQRTLRHSKFLDSTRRQRISIECKTERLHRFT